MILKRFDISFADPAWNRLTSFSLILFFILLADALLSYWVPNFLQDSLQSAFTMGLVMSFSSVVGFAADLMFPQVLRGYTVRKLLLSGITVSLCFIVTMALGVTTPNLFVFLIAMAIWGVYYEYLGFATQQFVSDAIPLKMHTTGWAVIDIFKNLAYLIGPIAAGWFLLRGEYNFLLITAVILALAFVIFSFTGRHHHERPLSIEPADINIWRELAHWRILFTRVWPVVFISLFMGLIDATFWTTGAVWTGNLAEESVIGSLILAAYQLPSLFMGIIIAKWKIYDKKKFTAEKFLLLSGLTLCLLAFDLPVILYVLIVFVSSIFLAVTFPLSEAVYTDLTSRMGVERKHLVGLSSSTMSLAYIISPAIAGYVSSLVGEKSTFVVIGSLTVLVSLILLMVTPKKLHLPQGEIAKWED